MTARKLTFLVERGDRLDRAIAAASEDVSRRQARTLIQAGAVFVDGQRCRVAGRVVTAGARVVAHLEPPPQAPLHGEALTVLWEADDLVAVNKPPGLHVNETETSAEQSVVSSFGGRVYVVHRLDRGTSGVLLVARTPTAAAMAGRLFEMRQVEKTYWAITLGAPSKLRVDAPLGVDRRRPRARAVRTDGKQSCTEFEVLGQQHGLAGVRARPRTGRTHQIRVHLAHASSPIVGDLLYGGPAASRVGDAIVQWPRVMLHAARLSFSWAGRAVDVTAPTPDDFLGYESLGLPASVEARSVES